MIVPSNDEIEHEPSLIEDIVMPHAEQFTDTTKEVVRHRSVGNLQQQYELNQKKKIDPKEIEHSSSNTKTSPKIRYSNYTVVPPMQTLPDLYSGTASSALVLQAPKEFIKSAYKQLAQAIHWSVGIAVGLRIWLGKNLHAWLPKRYTASRGVVTDWGIAISRAKVILPVLVVLLFLGLKLLPDSKQPSIPTSGQPQNTVKAAAPAGNNSKKKNDGASETTAQNNSVQPLPSNAISTPRTVPAVPPAAVLPSATVPSAPSTSLPSVGGMGSGDSASPIDPSIPLNLILTVPPTNVQEGDKTLINNNGSNTTIN